MKSLSRRTFIKAVGAAGPLVAVGALNSSAVAETVLGTPISTLPFKIIQSGTYYLQSDLVYAGNGGAAIEILTSNVVLDLNGYTLRASNTNTAAGIKGSSSFDCTVRNGTVDNFFIGVILDSAYRSAVEGIRVRSAAGGIFVTGSNCRIEGNEILSLVPYTGGACGGALGIAIEGSSGFETNLSSTIANNSILSSRTNSQSTVLGGLYVGKSVPNTSVINNRLVNLDLGVVYDDATGVKGKYRKNFTANVTRPYVGGIDAQENV